MVGTAPPVVAAFVTLTELLIRSQWQLKVAGSWPLARSLDLFLCAMFLVYMIMKSHTVWSKKL